MFDALENDEIDGILMDKYKVGYYLEKRNDDRFKMFHGFEAVIPYYVAIRDSDPVKEMTSEGACFDRQIEGQAVKEILLNHLQPVKVSKTQGQIVTLLGDTPHCNHVGVKCVDNREGKLYFQKWLACHEATSSLSLAPNGQYFAHLINTLGLSPYSLECSDQPYSLQCSDQQRERTD